MTIAFSSNSTGRLFLGKSFTCPVVRTFIQWWLGTWFISISYHHQNFYYSFRFFIFNTIFFLQLDVSVFYCNNWFFLICSFEAFIFNFDSISQGLLLICFLLSFTNVMHLLILKFFYKGVKSLFHLVSCINVCQNIELHFLFCPSLT